jgi:hypothetical protein
MFHAWFHENVPLLLTPRANSADAECHETVLSAQWGHTQTVTAARGALNLVPRVECRDSVTHTFGTWRRNAQKIAVVLFYKIDKAHSYHTKKDLYFINYCGVWDR